MHYLSEEEIVAQAREAARNWFAPHEDATFWVLSNDLLAELTRSAESPFTSHHQRLVVAFTLQLVADALAESALATIRTTLRD